MDRNLISYFELFNEIGIISQLSRTLLERRLPDGLGQPQFSVLNHLVRLGDGVTPGTLAHAFQVPRNSMTNTLQGLEERALIETRANPQDGRSRRVFLTAKGRGYLESAIESLSGDLKEIAEHLPLGDVERLLPQLTVVRRILDENRPY